jgi:3-hydroxymyristoyl/3-hydroxydecanoyl-(acyl carrier protein) dehydratase
VTEHQAEIGCEHPALAGHFPGKAIVPGVTLLGEVLCAVERAFGPGIRVTGLPLVKFNAPLAPGERVTIALGDRTGGRIRFAVRRAEGVIASGILQYKEEV